MEDRQYKSAKSICTFCQTPIKSASEELLCPSCTSPYHKDCWIENKGCAVYGCGEKLRADDEESSFRGAIINIEYLINRNQYAEAILEAKQLLNIDRRSTELKNLYNKAVSLINNKINLMTSGDEAFGKKDYKAAEIYYKNVLKYADDVETNFVNTRLEIAKEKIPDQTRKKIFQNILIIVIILAILSAIGFLGYYTFVLKEDRDFAELVKSDNARDVRSMEQMIGKYENFIKTYNNNGRTRNSALKRIYNYSYLIAGANYKDDWKVALKYYNKISNSTDAKQKKTLYENIYNTAYNDFKQKISNAKKLNSISKYSEALNELNNALSIISFFPNSDMEKEKNIVESNVTLLNKKVSLIVKSNDLEREIREQDKQLNNIRPSGLSKSSIIIAARFDKKIEPDIYIGKEVGTGNSIAVKTSKDNYTIGKVVSLECTLRGNIPLPDGEDNDLLIPLYIPFLETGEITNNDLTSSERDAISERIKILKTQKAKIESLLKQNLL